MSPSDTVLDDALAAELARWREAGLARSLPTDGPMAQPRADFTSNDYLALSRAPAVIEAARAALAQHGTGGRASRLLGGGTTLDRSVERATAAWLDTEDALLFPSGFQAAVGVLPCLATRGDVVLTDALVHASWIDASRLSRATVLPFRHLDLEHLDQLLARSRGARRRIVITEGIFSMDGDAPDLAALAEMCARRDAWLVVDEAHSAGLLGDEGAGAWAAARSAGAPSERLVARLVTGGKALGVCGALVAGSAHLRSLFVHRARSFVFTTALSPAVPAALERAIELARGADEARAHVRSLAARLADGAGQGAQPSAAIVPHVVGAAERAVELASELRGRGFAVAAVRPPTVPRDTARLRLVLHASNTEEQVDALTRALAQRALDTVPLAAKQPPTRRPLFVVGTDTGVGKTVVSALLARAAAARGNALYWKPVQTGDDSDTLEVTRLCQGATVDFTPPTFAFALPASPHEAAAAEGAAVDTQALAARLQSLSREGSGTLIAEFAGGLCVPLTDEFTQADWLARERADCVLVARSGLGTLNHTLLTLEALAARGLAPRALFLVGPRHASNRATLARHVPHTFEVEPFEPLEPAALDAWAARQTQALDLLFASDLS